MRGERERHPEALMARYGIGRRLAARVAALLARNIDVTGTVLASAAEEEAGARLLLSPELLRSAQQVSEQWLRQRARELDYAEADLLRLVEDSEGAWRTIALEDDLLVAEVGGEPAEGIGTGEMALARRRPGEISSRETQELFSPEEVARLKLLVLTSQNPDERVEALRKLVFAPMEGAQKAQVLLNVLTDREAELRVRREAVRALEQIGFRQDMAEAVRGVLSEDEDSAVYAAQRLSALLQEAEPGESALALAVVLEVLDQAPPPAIARALLELMGRSATTLVTNFEKSEQFVRAALRCLSRDFDEVRFEVERAFRACTERAPKLMADLIWVELQRSEDARVRSLLLSMVEGIAEGAERIEEIARRAVAEILNPRLPESEKAGLRYSMVRLGEPAARVALERLAAASPEQRTDLIRVLDVVCTESDVSDETVRRTVNAFLEQLKLADTLTRRTILEADILDDARVPAPMQREMSRELLTLMSELNLPDSLELIRTTLEKIGPPALDPSYSFLRRNYPSAAAERAALAMGNIVENHAGEVPGELARKALQLCRELLADDSVKHGAFTLTLAAVCGYTREGSESLEECLKELRDNLWSLPYTTDALDALAVMAGSPNARPEHQQEMFELFDAIVRYQTRSGVGSVEETDEGTVYHFGREIQFDIRIVPSAVRGLERICVSPQASGQMRTAIVRRLLVLWEGVANVRVIWGPAAIEALVQAMCSAACLPAATVQMKTRLGESLLRFLNKISVVRSIGRIFSQQTEERELHKLAVRVGNELLDNWEAADVQDDERRLALLQAAGAIAANASLDPEAEAVQDLRERTLEALFRGLRDGYTGVRSPLIALRDTEGVTPAQKREIDERLGKIFGLERRDRVY